MTLARWFDCACSVGDEPRPQYWLNGRFAAVNRYSCSPISAVGECSGKLRVADLSIARFRRSIDTGGVVSDLVLTRRGSVALITPRGLQKSDGSERVTLDAFALPGSLAYAARTATLYWTSANEPRSAHLR